MFLNPKYGKIGLLSFPYWVLFEWMAPIVEFIGIIYFLFLLWFDMVNMQVFWILSLLVFFFSLTFSSFAIFYETYIFNRYKGHKFLLIVFFTAILEMVIYHPLNIIFALSGNYDFFIKKNKKGWGKMTRTGFTKKK